MALVWDATKKTFIDSDSNLSLSPAKVLTYLELTIDQGFTNLDELADQLLSQDITLESFSEQVAEILKTMHVAQALKAKAGIDTLTESNLKVVSKTLEEQLVKGTGIDENGNKVTFGLLQLINEVNRGEVSIDQLKNRLKLYGDSSINSKNQVEFDDKKHDEEFTECLNILNKVKTKHHPRCIEATARGWMKIKEMEEYGLPKRHAACKCNLIYK